MSATGVNLLYLVTIVCFILALRFLSSPATARRGNQIGAVGMVVAIVATLLRASVHLTWLMVIGALIGLGEDGRYRHPPGTIPAGRDTGAAGSGGD